MTAQHYVLWFGILIAHVNAKLIIDIITFTVIHPTKMGISFPWIALPFNDAFANFSSGLLGNVTLRHQYITDSAVQTCHDMDALCDYRVSEYYYTREAPLPDMTVLLHTDNESASLNRLAAGWNTLMLTCIEATDADLQDQGYADTWVTSSMLAFDGLNAFVVDILTRFKWKSVFLVNDEIANAWFRGAYKSVMRAIRSNVGDSQVNGHVLTREEAESNDFAFLTRTQEVSRIVLYLGDTRSLRLLMAAAAERGMLINGEFVFIAVEPYPREGGWGNFTWKADDALDNILETAWRSLLLITLADNERDRKAFIAPRFPIWASLSKRFYGFDIPNDTVEINFSQVMAYEGMQIFLKVLEEAVQEDPLPDLADGRAFAKRFQNRTIQLPSGNVSFTKDGNRCLDLLLRDYDVQTKSWKPVLMFVSAAKSVLPLNDIDWPHRTGPPLNEPLCGYSGVAVQCTRRLDILPFMAGVAALAVAMFAGIFGFLYSRYAQERAAAARRWQLNIQYLLHASHSRTSSIMSSVEEILHPLSDFPDLQLQEETEITNTHYHGHMSYMGRQTWVKATETPDHHFHHYRQISKLLTSLSLLNNENVAQFIGMCYNHDKTSMLLLDEYCPRRSLNDTYLQLRSVSELKSSFVQDLLKGIKYIHESTHKKHGFLNSYCCLLSKNFTLKIGKLGYAQIRSLLNHKITVLKFDIGNDQEIFWTAPEVLRGITYPNQKCDIFSLGIILNEIFMAEAPYSDVSLSPAEVYQKAALSHYAETYRPRIDGRMMDRSMQDLIELCWHETPDKRPTIQKVFRSVSQIMDIRHADSLVGRILNRLQVYARDLEIKVQLRTADLLSEQRLCDALLQEMLPKSVVERLRAHKHVEPVGFDHTTVYFGDLLGFVDFASIATPLAVVGFLNTVYSCFDSLITTYDVYKVETIGDSYVVASGLPEPNGDIHVTEIAKMACRLMYEYRRATFRYNTQLRIGIHSGPIVAAVVGKTIPRYCLFGDTINTASRMMSHGQAGKIHISPETAFLLREKNAFRLTPRGLTSVKGKGDLYTFWLDACDAQRLTGRRSITEVQLSTKQ